MAIIHPGCRRSSIVSITTKRRVISAPPPSLHFLILGIRLASLADYPFCGPIDLLYAEKFLHESKAWRPVFLILSHCGEEEGGVIACGEESMFDIELDHIKLA